MSSINTPTFSGCVYHRQTRSSSREECLVKLLRLLANLSIHPAAGKALAARPEVSAALLSTLEQFGGCSSLNVSPGGGSLPSTGGGVDASSQDRHEELVLNCCSALTNLSFYQGDSNQVGGSLTRSDQMCSSAEVLLEIEATRLCLQPSGVVRAAWLDTREARLIEQTLH